MCKSSNGIGDRRSSVERVRLAGVPCTFCAPSLSGRLEFGVGRECRVFVAEERQKDEACWRWCDIGETFTLVSWPLRCSSCVWQKRNGRK